MGRNTKGRTSRIALAASLVAGLLIAVQTSAVAAGTDYRDTVLADDPVAYWRLGESSGTAVSDEVGTLVGTYEGSPQLGQPGLVVDADGAVRFGGDDVLVHIPDSSLINLATHTERTIEAWFSVEDAAPRQVIVEEGGGTRGLNIYVDGGLVYFGGWNTQNDSSPDTPWGGTFFSTPVTAGQAHHAVLILDQADGSLRGYLDGVEVGSGPAGTLHSHSADTGIGGMNNASRFHNSQKGGDDYHFVGVIDEVAFYNSVLTAADVAAHYDAGSTPAEDPSVTFVSPANGAIVSGQTTVEVAAADPQDSPSALTVEISTDGGASFTPAAFAAGPDTHSISWDTTASSDGLANLVARAEDTSGNIASSSIAVSVINNPGTDEYGDVVLADNPVVYYRLGEAGGSVVVDEQGAVDASYIGNPALGRAGLVAGPSTAVTFDGENDFIHVPDSSLINKGQFAQRSVEAWFNAADTGQRQVIYEEGAGTRGLSVYIESGQLYAGVWNLSGQSWGPVFVNASVAPATPHHVVAVLSGGNFELFLDGVAVGVVGGAGTLFNHGADTGIAAMNDSARFHDGNVAGDGFHFEGTIDEVAIYNVALGAGAVAAHYAAGVPDGPQDPSVNFFAPAAGSTLAGVVSVELTVSDPQDVVVDLAVEVSSDGVAYTSASFNGGSGRFEWNWDTTVEPDGPATLDARVTDLDGNTATSSVAVTIDNAVASDPTVTFFDPTDGATVVGVVTIEVTASDPQDPTDDLSVAVSTDDGATFAPAAFNEATGRHELVWDTTGLPDGWHTLVVEVTDTAANSTAATIDVTVGNVAANTPSVTFVNPADSSTVGGVVTIEVTATDPQSDPDLLLVDISTDGGVTYTQATYEPGTENHTLAWDTNASGDGSLTLVAMVSDPDAYSAMDSVVVTVDNTAANTPSAAFVNPVNSAVVSDTISIDVSAADPQSSPGQLTVDISTNGGATFAPAGFNPGPDIHSISWDTTSAPEGDVTLVAVVSDPDGYSSESQITVTVNNAPPAAYHDAVIASGPAVYWRLDEPGATTAFDTVGGLDSTYSGGPLLAQSGLVADANTAVSFDGNNDYVAVPDSSLINIGTRTEKTISAWFRADDTTTRQVIIDEGGVTRGLSMYVDQGQLYVGAWNPLDDPSSDTPWGPVFFSTPVVVGQIYNAVTVLDQPAGTFTAYLNGVSIGSGSAGTLHGHGSDTGIGAMNNATLFHDGSATGNGFYFDGTIDEVAFYNTALDAATVSNLYLIGAAQAEDPTVFFANPQNGGVVSGSITIEVSAADPQDAVSALDVEISIDGGATFSQASFNGGTFRHTLVWDTTSAPDGTNALVARVTDTDLNQTTAAINATVSNTGATHMIVAAGDIAHCNNTNDTDTANLITQIIAGTSLPVTVVPLGDLAYENGSAAEFANCYDPTWGQHKAITKPVPGNHDYNTPGAQGYYDYFGAVAAPPDGWYRYELAGWEIYTLNSNCGSIGTCGAATPQVQWLRSELAASTNACSLALFHHSRFTEQNPFNNLLEFWKAMYEFDGDLIMSAHAHYYAHSVPQDWLGNADPVNGVRQIIAGTGGRSLHSFPGDPHPNQEVVDNTTYGVVVLELSAGGYDWSFRRVGDGAILYSGSGTCH